MIFIEERSEETVMNKASKEERMILYQSKYEYYRYVCIYAVLFSVLASNTYWISDCQLFGRIAWETLFPRLFMLLPLAIYLVISKYVTSYKVMIPLSYLMLHGIMWCTIWAIYYLPIKQHANEGFIIMHIMFVAIGMCSPFRWSVFFHSLLIFDILISYPINHYESIDLMMSLGIPVLLATETIMYIIQKSYKEQYTANNKIEYMLIHDQLTGAYNRNKLDELCVTGTNTFDLKRTSILLLDIDFFKKINDTYGHAVGDKVLKKMVQLIKSVIREDDLVIRWGGEEFLVLVKDCVGDDAVEVAERIRRTIENCDTEECRFTISLGITEYRYRNYIDTIKEADKALYYAKEHGRNRVVQYDKEIM